MLKDSGERRKFKSGAVRDCAEGKGRCDLLPLDIVSGLLTAHHLKTSKTLSDINQYLKTGDACCLGKAILSFCTYRGWDVHTATIEASKQFEDGAKKYGDNNWRKGIPLHCYIDSGVRHYLKYMRGDTDEPHDRAFVWNMLCALWTHKHKPELIDLPFVEDKS